MTRQTFNNVLKLQQQRRYESMEVEKDDRCHEKKKKTRTTFYSTGQLHSYSGPPPRKIISSLMQLYSSNNAWHLNQKRTWKMRKKESWFYFMWLEMRILRRQSYKDVQWVVKCCRTTLFFVSKHREISIPYSLLATPSVSIPQWRVCCEAADNIHHQIACITRWWSTSPSALRKSQIWFSWRARGYSRRTKRAWIHGLKERK